MREFMSLEDFTAAVRNAKAEGYAIHLSTLQLPDELMMAVEGSKALAEMVPEADGTALWYIHRDTEILFQQLLSSHHAPDSYIPVYPFNTYYERLNWDKIWVEKRDVTEEIGGTEIDITGMLRTALAYSLYGNLGGLMVNDGGRVIGSLPILRACRLCSVGDEQEVRPLTLSVIYDGNGQHFFEAEIPPSRVDKEEILKRGKIIGTSLREVCEKFKKLNLGGVT